MKSESPQLETEPDTGEWLRSSSRASFSGSRLYNSRVPDHEDPAEKSGAADRRRWSVRKYRLGAEPSDDLSDSTTPEQRIEMMWALALEAWSLSGQPLPDYSRGDTPIRRVLRKPSESA